ncbi:MAG TPA: nuclear transport factor 2 family protein, partial [Acidimicrobiales bacterium]|nr:nuclear transport factor 2 family protein [Acidimicrobiales bacterium]
TLLLDDFCGDFHDWFGPKMGATAYLGDHVVSCQFDVAGNPASRVFYKLLGTSAPSMFHHIDRTGMDAAMYERMARTSTCEIVDAKIESIDYNAVTDKVDEIGLSNGHTLRPRIVFDCTNHKRAVPQAAGVPVQTVGVPQRVIYTHYHPTGGVVAEPRPAYDLSTNLVRLFREIDGIDAVAWYIPIPTYLSVGVSMAADSNDLGDDEVLACVERAYAARGIRYRGYYPDTAPVMTLHHRYFVHDRAAGANWLLAGQTYASVWWMAGAGVGTSFVAGRMAADFATDPARTGRAYGALLKNLLPIHNTFDWMATATLEEVTAESMRRFSDGFIRTNVVRLAKSAQANKRAVPRTCGRLLEVLVDKELVLKDFCDVVTAPLADQTESVFGPEPGTDAAAEAVEVVLRLADVISGRLPVETVDDLLDEKVVSHLDGITVRGRKTWRTWLGHLRSRAPSLELADAAAAMGSDGRITLRGHWSDHRRAAPEEATAAYRVKDGRITEIWTTSDNYTFVFGPMMKRPYGKYVASLQAGLWARRARTGSRQH